MRSDHRLVEMVAITPPRVMNSGWTVRELTDQAVPTRAMNRPEFGGDLSG